MYIIALCLPIVLCSVISADNKHISCSESSTDYGYLCLQILGQSGKMILGFPEDSSSTDPTSGGQWVEIRYRSIFELDSDMEPVGKAGSKKHSIQSFATLDFTIDPMSLIEVGDVEAMWFNMSANILIGDTVSKMRADFWLFTEDGEADIGGEDTIDVLQGDIKWNLGIDDWEWCDNAEQNCGTGGNWEHGAALMVHMEISGPNGTLIDYGEDGGTTGPGNSFKPCNGPAAQSNPNCQTGNPGTGVQFDGRRLAIFFEDQVRYGDSSSRSYDDWEPMMDGYPDIYAMTEIEDTLDTIGVDLVFERRAGKSSMEYDPVATTIETQADWGPNDGAASMGSSAWLFCSVLILASLISSSC